MKPITVLLTGCGAPGAPGIIKCLRKNGEREIRIVSVDMNENAASRTFVDAFYTVPAGPDPGFIDRVLDVCRTEKVEAVLPIVTRELEVFAAAKARFEDAGIKVNVMDPGPLHTANNKGLLLSAMREAGLPTPEFRVVHMADEVEAAVKELGYPEKAVVVKPTFGNGSRGTRILDPKVSCYDLFFKEKPGSMYISFSELMETLRERDTIPEMMVMEYLPGEEYKVDTLVNRGSVLTAVCRHDTLVIHSNTFGSVSQQNPDAIGLCASVIRHLGLDGNVNFDLKENTDGAPRLMEINPRLGGGVVSCAVAGVNFPYLGLKKLLGEPIPVCTVRDGIVMRRRNAEIFFAPDGSEIDW